VHCLTNYNIEEPQPSWSIAAGCESVLGSITFVELPLYHCMLHASCEHHDSSVSCNRQWMLQRSNGFLMAAAHQAFWPVRPQTTGTFRCFKGEHGLPHCYSSMKRGVNPTSILHSE
jgi:hypothetical protein